ncbi:integrase and RNaseH domain-containing protein, partial [Golovinomyces cichoracearum]
TVTDFEQWTASEFKALDSRIRRELRQAVRYGGIYTGRSGARYDAQFPSILTLESLSPWDEYELQTADLHANTEANRQRKELSRLDQTRGSTQTNQASEGNDIDTQDPNTSIPSAPLIKAIGTSRITHKQNSNEDLDDPSSIDSKEYLTIPPKHVSNQPLDAAKVTTFVRIWDKSYNYTGEPYDILDEKVRYFLDICFAAQVKPSQFYAVFSMALAKRAKDYYLANVDSTATSRDIMRAENEDKDPAIILQKLLDRLQQCQRALGPSYQGEDQLMANTVRACRRAQELRMGFFTTSVTFEQLSSQLRSSLETVKQRTISKNFHTESNSYFIDRKFNRRRNNKDYRPGPQQENSARSQTKRCYVCRKQRCWSSNHSEQERQLMRYRYFKNLERREKQSNEQKYSAYLLQYEEKPEQNEEDDIADSTDDDDEVFTRDIHFTAAYLSDKAFIHRQTANLNEYNENDEAKTNLPQLFLLDRYNREIFQRIIPDSGAVNTSTAGKYQVEALKLQDPSVTIEISKAGEAKRENPMWGDKYIPDQVSAY